MAPVEGESNSPERRRSPQGCAVAHTAYIEPTFMSSDKNRLDVIEGGQFHRGRSGAAVDAGKVFEKNTERSNTKVCICHISM